MDKEQVYARLEEKFLQYRELAATPVRDCGEKMVPLSGSPVRSVCLDERMKQYTGDEVYVREGLVPRLALAQECLSGRAPGLFLEVFYGYRHLQIQVESFEEYKKEVLRTHGPGLAEEDMKERVHHFIAVPEVAGHPTGGAVDIRILGEDGHPIDMGTPASAYVKDSYTFSPYISRQAWRNRQILRECMTAAGFAPFDGEWWHFSYGDREWAAYYRKEAAIYSQVELAVPEAARRRG